MELNSVVKNLKYSVIRSINEEAAKYEDVIGLTIGEPDIPPPQDLVDEALEFAKTTPLFYAPTGGGADVRRLVAEHYNKIYGCQYNENNVVMNIGSSEALSSVLKTIINPGDEVIVPAPYYPGYIPMIEMAYGIPVEVDTLESDLVLTPELLDRYITPKTKAIVLSNPSNPAGTVMSREAIERIAEYLEDKDVFLIADEIYSALSFEEFYSFGACRNIQEKLIIVNGFSKSHSMTGWRIGFTIAPESIRRNFLNATLYNVSSPMTLSLHAGKIALEKYPERRDLVDIYSQRAYYLRDRLNELGFKVIEPKGAFYLFVGYSDISKKNSLDFSMDLLKEARVAVVPGITFGSENYFRIALTQDISVLQVAADRIQDYVNKL